MQKNYNENLVAGAAIRDDKGRRISKLFEASHPKMTVGYAKNLIMPDTPTEQEFNFRQSGGGVIEDGVAVIDKVKGNSVVWNQRVEVKRTFTANGVHFEKNGNSVKVYTDTDGATVTTAFTDTLGSKNWSQVAIVGHKYAMSGCPNGGSQNSFRMSCYSSNSWQGEKFDTGNGVVFSVTESVPNGYPRITVSQGTIITTPIYFRPQLIDLTQMFGAGNEPSTYEEFLSRKPKVADEYAYDEGTIVDNKVEKVVTTGRNIWDESKRVNGKYIDHLTGEEISNAAYSHTGYVRVLPNTEYYFKQGTEEPQYGAYYDADKNFILGIPNFKGVFITPAQAAYVRITLGAADSSDNICINLSDPTINGKYFPYEEHELDLSWIKEIKDAEGVKLFEDGIKSAGTAFDEIAKGRAIKRIGVKIFDGTEDWALSSGMYYLGDHTLPNSPKVVNSICNTYSFSNKTAGFQPGDDHTYGLQALGAIVFNDSTYTGVTAWKSHLAELYAAGTPLIVYYELAEPIEVEYDEKNLTYPVVAGGTEEAIASEPSTAFRADIGYGIDAVKTILDLKARVEALEGK